MSKICCEHMGDILTNYKIVSYRESIRLFSLDLLVGMQKEIWFCPWCGTKMPDNLDTAWQRTLREEYALQDPIFDDKDKVPQEFRTDEWWKKRGL